MGACPDETKGAGGLGSIAEQEVDHQRRRAPRWRSRPLRADDRQRPGRGEDRGPVRAGAGLSLRHRCGVASTDSPTSTASPSSASSTRATCRLSGPAPRPRWARAMPPVPCTEDQRPANEPSLSAMTQKALDLLTDRNNDDGILPSGRGGVDRQAGSRRPTPAGRSARRSRSTTRSASRSITSAVIPTRSSWSPPITPTRARSCPRTPRAAACRPATRPTCGPRTASTMTLTYGTAGYNGQATPPSTPPPSQQHTGAVVPVWGVGPGAIERPRHQRSHRPVRHPPRLADQSGGAPSRERLRGRREAARDGALLRLPPASRLGRSIACGPRTRSSSGRRSRRRRARRSRPPSRTRRACCRCSPTRSTPS